MNAIITRFAPSPTGHLHIGGARTALINFIYSKQAKKKNPLSKFLLRIEDTDRKRFKEEYIDGIINGLEWLGIKWDDEIYYQSKRILHHQKIAINLLKNNHAFKCNCSSKKLENIRKENLKNNKSIKRLCENCEFNEKVQNLKENYCIRLKVPNEGKILIKDLIQGDVIVQNKEIDNFILLRQNYTPTYMLSVVVDDHDMKITSIIRGDDHFINTFRQAHLYKKLQWQLPEFAHLPLVHGLDGTKLSKRHGSVDINELNKLGYLPKAIINNLILLGWSPKNNNEIIEIDEIIKKYNLEKLSKSSSIFNYQKLDFFNYHYIQENESYNYFAKYISNNDSMKHYIIDNKKIIKKIYDVYKTKIKKLEDLNKIIKIFFDKNFIAINNKSIDNNFRVLLIKFADILKLNKKWDEYNLDVILKEFIKNEMIKFSVFGKPLRHILTNSQDGPSLILIFLILGKINTLHRINSYLNN